MPFNKSEYDQNYIKTHIRRVVIGFQNADYDRLKRAADSVGEPVNTFIKKAIAERIGKMDTPPDE